MKKIFTFLILLSLVNINAQIFKGQVFLRDNSILYLNQIFVTNLNTQKTVLSDYNGEFRIAANEGDRIRFTSIVTERKDVSLNKTLLENSNNLVELKIAYHEIQEVVLSRFKPSGNLRKDVASLKSSEKALEIQKMLGLPEPKGDGNPPQLPVAGFSGGGLTFSIDTIYDILSGEKKKKERYYAYEKMNISVQKMKNYYGTEYFTNMKIPEYLIENFLQFVYTSDRLSAFIDAGNYEAAAISIEKYLPIYLKRLDNSSLRSLVK
ncbi:hypothetical protein [Chryseobacterium sp.]|uniref:hypothetical protein n=1 Tax=Chryseobacterium sp. TaxID=1871047 RepID=UPI0011CB1F90|nr:hypothetical protein [Chryseobacterium sp.]TXF77208.1 hypothetical protein FUA25_04520 [Chryseobacterium sp.]